MRIGINCSVISGRLTGVGYYVSHLVDALIRFEKGHEWVLLGLDSEVAAFSAACNVSVIAAPALHGWRRIAWEQQALPRLVKREGLDLLHCPDFSRPLLTSTPVVNTFHDLSYYARGFFSVPKLAYKRALTRVSVLKSSSLIAVSRFTRDQLVERFAVDPVKVKVIYSGVEIPAAAPVDPPSQPFVLFVGTLEKRKNVRCLIEAFTKLNKEREMPYRLVLAGQQGEDWPEVASALEASSVRRQIEVLGYVSQADIYRLYRSADLLVYPSYYEGFGLPIIEAMACGLPVICSSTTALPEAGGEAAIYFNPQSPDELKQAMQRVLSSTDLRAQMRQKGLQHAARFSWEKCARQHCELYQQTSQN
jgi:glycosyltransferase involved in cell wall biosynthesis